MTRWDLQNPSPEFKISAEDLEVRTLITTNPKLEGRGGVQNCVDWLSGVQHGARSCQSVSVRFWSCPKLKVILKINSVPIQIPYKILWKKWVLKILLAGNQRKRTANSEHMLTSCFVAVIGCRQTQAVYGAIDTHNVVNSTRFASVKLIIRCSVMDRVSAGRCNVTAPTQWEHVNSCNKQHMSCYVNTYNSSSETADTIIHWTLTEVGRHAFSVAATIVWNSLPV